MCSSSRSFIPGKRGEGWGPDSEESKRRHQCPSVLTFVTGHWSSILQGCLSGGTKCISGLSVGLSRARRNVYWLMHVAHWSQLLPVGCQSACVQLHVPRPCDHTHRAAQAEKAPGHGLQGRPSGCICVRVVRPHGAGCGDRQESPEGPRGVQEVAQWQRRVSKGHGHSSHPSGKEVASDVQGPSPHSTAGPSPAWAPAPQRSAVPA